MSETLSQPENTAEHDTGDSPPELRRHNKTKKQPASCNDLGDDIFKENTKKSKEILESPKKSRSPRKNSSVGPRTSTKTPSPKKKSPCKPKLEVDIVPNKKETLTQIDEVKIQGTEKNLEAVEKPETLRSTRTVSSPKVSKTPNTTESHNRKSPNKPKLPVEVVPSKQELPTNIIEVIACVCNLYNK